jgi:hypothetical protein
MLHRFDPRRLLRRSPVAPAANELPTDSATEREHYIPLRKSDLVDRLAADSTLELDERAGLLQFCKLLEATIHHQYHDRLESLKQAYAPFDPDADARPLAELDEVERTALARKLFVQFSELLERANFRRLSREDLEAALNAASDWSVNVQVDLSIFEQLEVFVRGDVVGKKATRNFATQFRSQLVEVPTYQRLAVIFRLKPSASKSQLDSAAVVLKLFKNIPKADVEMLLPGTTVRMTLLDRGKILLPTLSGVGLTAIKLLHGAATLATASLQGMLALLGLLGGTVGYGVKSFLGYLRTRDKYHLNLTRSLYYQNLDNNAGVLFRLLDEAEEQEFRETLLAWWLLRDFRDTGATSQQLDQSAERWLRERCALNVDFEVDDALDKLNRLGLANRLLTSNRAAPRYRATDIASALETLDRAWDKTFSYHKPAESPAINPARRAA